MEKGKEISVTSHADLIEMAISKGADLAQVEKLLELKERHEGNEAKKAFNKAMSDFKKNPPKIDKDKHVAYGNTKYNHASLANVVEKISTELSKHGLSATWRTKQNGQIIVTCKITHELGHSEETSLSANADTSGSKNPIQAIGSAVSYLQRYTLLAITGLATYDGDNDGQGAEEPKIDETQVAHINKKLDEIKADRAKFLEYMKLEKIEDMVKKDYAKAMMAINTSKQRKAEAEVKDDSK